MCLSHVRNAQLAAHLTRSARVVAPCCARPSSWGSADCGGGGRFHSDGRLGGLGRGTASRAQGGAGSACLDPLSASLGHGHAVRVTARQGGPRPRWPIPWLDSVWFLGLTQAVQSLLVLFPGTGSFPPPQLSYSLGSPLLPKPPHLYRFPPSLSPHLEVCLGGSWVLGPETDLQLGWAGCWRGDRGVKVLVMQTPP